MANLRAYPDYKPSHVEWLGDVPAHWQVRRFGTFAKGFGNGLATAQLEFGESAHLVSRIETISNGTVDYTRVGYLSNDSDYDPYLLSKDDFLISHINSYAKVGNSARYKGERPLIHGMNLIRVTPLNRVFPAHLEYMLKSIVFLGAMRRACKPAINQVSVTTRSIKAVQFPLPPLPEQRAIVRYLDHVDDRIRRYVSAKEKLIALLEEERQAVIHRAVTRCLDPNVPLKPSGVEWLRDVPAHWEVRRLGYLATKFGSGITPRGGATVYQDSGVPFLRSQNIHFDGLRIQDVARIPPRLHGELSSSHVKPGDVLLNITGASIGRVCSVPDDFIEGNVNQHVCIIRPKRSHLLPNLLAAYLSTSMMQREIQFEQSGASREGLTLHSIRNFKVFVPPLPEQTAIVEHLDRATAAIDDAISRARRQIELLREYRMRLIADVVTGKLDVRQTTANLPDETGR